MKELLEILKQIQELSGIAVEGVEGAVKGGGGEPEGGAAGESPEGNPATQSGESGPPESGPPVPPGQ